MTVSREEVVSIWENRMSLNPVFYVNAGMQKHRTITINHQKCSQKFRMPKISVVMQADKRNLPGAILWIQIFDGKCAIFLPAVSLLNEEYFLMWYVVHLVKIFIPFHRWSECNSLGNAASFLSASSKLYYEISLFNNINCIWSGDFTSCLSNDIFMSSNMP